MEREEATRATLMAQMEQLRLRTGSAEAAAQRSRAVLTTFLGERQQAERRRQRPLDEDSGSEDDDGESFQHAVYESIKFARYDKDASPGRGGR